MVKDNVTVDEHKWRLVLKTLEKRYEAFAAEISGAEDRDGLGSRGSSIF
jgi:hypothetical protein